MQISINYSRISYNRTGIGPLLSRFETEQGLGISPFIFWLLIKQTSNNCILFFICNKIKICIPQQQIEYILLFDNNI